MIRRCPFVKVGKIIYVPSPDSWLGGWARQRWLERYFDNDLQIRNLGAESWADIVMEHKVKILTEEGGKYSESKKRKKK